ncbi:diguanylate cyclase (GGDEF)-like protein [Undibacterium sp. GrIS 1.8]
MLLRQTGAHNLLTQITSQAQLDIELSALSRQTDATIESEPAQTIALILKAIAQAEATIEFRADPVVIGELHCKIGNCRIILHDPSGIRDFEIALEYAEKNNSLELKADVLHGLARTFLAFGDTNSALQYAEKAIAIERQVDRPKKFAQILITLGFLFTSTQQFERSLTIYKEAYVLCEKNQDQDSLARVKNNWADSLIIYYEVQNEDGASPDVQMLDDAILYTRQSLVHAQTNKMVRTQLLATETLAHALEERSLYDLALQELGHGLDQFSGYGFAKEELDIKVRIGALQLRMHQLQAAVASMIEARDFAMRLGNYPHLADLLKILSHAYEMVQNFEAALKVYKEFHTITLKARDQRAQVSAQIFAAKMDLERAQQEAIVHKNRVNQLEDFNRTLRVQVNEDTLTGLPNRRALEEKMATRLTGTITNVAFAMADIDFFKKVNDGYSHLIGDEVLRQVGRLISSCLRSGDMAARIGGEEFALLFDRTAKSVEACERIRNVIAAYDWSTVAAGLHITMSFGVTHIRDGDDLKAMMIRADAALYRAKDNGRNRVEKA